MGNSEYRKHIIQLAVEEFTSQGLLASSLNSIVRASGLSKGAFYHHFANKEQLIEAVVSEFLFPLITNDWLKPLSRSKKPVEQLKRSILGASRFSDPRTRECMRLLLVFMNEFSILPDKARGELRNLNRRWLKVVSRVFQSNKHLTSSNHRSNALNSHILLCAMFGAWQMSGVTNSQLDLKKVLPALLDDLIN